MSLVRAAGAALLVGLLACSSSDAVCIESPAVRGGADSARIVRSNDALRWIEPSLEEIRQADPIAQALAQGAIVDPAHPAVVWLQAWAEQIDGIVRAEVERELGEPLKAPTPIVLLEPGEFDIARMVSLPAMVQQPEGEATTLIPFRPYFYPVGSPEIQAINPASALTQPPSWNDKAAIADYLQTHAGVGNVEIEDERIRLGCSEFGGAEAGLSMYGMTPYLVLAVPLAKKFSADAMLGTLTHELAHFYRAHGTPGSTPGYWFENAAAATWEPPESDNAAAIEKAYRQVVGDGGEADPALVERVRANDIGYMTVEIEADRLAARILAAAGFDTAAVTAIYREYNEKLGSGRYASPGACVDLIDADFRDEAGNLVFVAPFVSAAEQERRGQEAVAHAQLCYRAFDMKRQMQAGVYAIGSRPQPAVGSWDDAKQSL